MMKVAATDVMALVLLIGLGGCNGEPPSAVPDAPGGRPPHGVAGDRVPIDVFERRPVAARLRVRNTGPSAIRGLVVSFPGDRDGSSQNISFGDVAVGATTPYRQVAAGVYRYAAYEYRVQGRARVQPVIDFTGEVPLPGGNYTYVLRVEPMGSLELSIREIDVRREP